MSELPKNVQRGMEFLDREYPTWRDKIDPDSLDMNDCFDCILGQLEGGYWSGLKRLGLSAPAKHGFTTWGRQSYTTLTAAWRKVLA